MDCMKNNQSHLKWLPISQSFYFYYKMMLDIYVSDSVFKW